MTTITTDGVIKIPNNKYADRNIVWSFKGRQIDLEKPISVYRNLNKKCYSIMQEGIVVAHAERLCMKNCTFKVNRKNRQRVIESGHKNVHAFIVGFYETSMLGTTAERNDLPAIIKYDPYNNENFICENLTENPVIMTGARFCILDSKEVRAAYTIQR